MENTCDFLVGIVVLRSIILVITPPAVSIPSDRGATSRSSSSLVLLLPCPVRIDACTAAPYATASSGFSDLLSCLPLKYEESSS